jgi:hypothetical protein
MKKLHFTALFVILGCLNIHAQQNTIAGSCNGVEFHQFDFWLGEWEVFNKQGIKVGENEIIRLQEGCVLQENWKSPDKPAPAIIFTIKATARGIKFTLIM